jgi:hypothetical protein
MKSLQPVTSSAAALFRSLPLPGRVAVVIVGALVALYIWQLLLGFLFLAAVGVGLVQIVKWFISH